MFDASEYTDAEHEAFKAQLRKEAMKAFGVTRLPPLRRRPRWLRTRYRLARLGIRRALPPLTEAEYAATIPQRVQDIADDLNERMADVLPPGMRFEWTTTEDTR